MSRAALAMTGAAPVAGAAPCPARSNMGAFERLSKPREFLAAALPFRDAIGAEAWVISGERIRCRRAMHER